ncbi:MAG TPA: LysR substrate-binding domain-containing protein [Magnetospirillaceae bacterium]|jgi:DNA-binding transcriptional LysR family regulator
MSAINLDMDVLRTIVTAQRLGGFNRAAEQVGRSQSAVSQQIHKLEERIGQPLFKKRGRMLELTEAGEMVLAYARRILDLNDEAVTAVRGASVEGAVRFGMPADFAETWLPMTLGRFKRTHPGVRVEASVDRNYLNIERLDRGQMDLVVAFGRSGRSDALPVASLPMAWIGAADGSLPWNPGEPVPLAMFEGSCVFRSAATEALDAAGIPWTISFTSPGLPGLWAAVTAGLGITLRTAAGLPNTLRQLGPRDGLPPVSTIELAMHDAGRPLTPASVRLREIIFDALDENIAALPGAKLIGRR